MLHAGHIVGPDWTPINPVGNTDPRVFDRLARGEEVALPNFGMETLHHVHADDVAQAFQRAIERWSVAAGEAYHVVSPRAVTLRGYAEAAAGWFGREPNLTTLPFAEWAERTDYDEGDVETTRDHISHSPSLSLEKARDQLGYEPRYTSLEACREAVVGLAERDEIDADL
jgi:nucleoside-diphosphate-sugar epimerase